MAALLAAAARAEEAADSYFRLPENPARPRGYFFPPLASFFLPGLDQWWESQNSAALAYTGTAVGGIYLANFAARAGNSRLTLLGALMYQGAGGFSAYHSFRSAVDSRHEAGREEFKFLGPGDKPLEILAAPLHFQYLVRPTTFIPLGIGLALNIFVATQDPSAKVGHLRLDDGFFAGAYSWNAGTHEEAFFRGWVHPMFTEWTGTPWLANTLQASLFALAHLPTNAVPWPQFVLGWYWGWLTEHRGWSITENVFIHAWWDVMAFGFLFATKSDSEKEAVWLPLAQIPL